LFTASCAVTARHLSEHLDGELRGLRRLRVARHLGECPRCRAVYETLVRTVSSLRALGRELPPERPELADAVVRRIEATP
jgi:predicted anti-sigma-YlaC factor YlaD